ncbi:MAG: flagellar hook-length control protein FliK [bacterium]
MNFLISHAGFLNNDNISLIIKDKITASLFEIIKPGGIIEANLIGAATGAENSLNGLFSLNGKIFTAGIPEGLYNEFTMGKAFDNNFNIPVKLRLETINGANNNGNGAEIIFKVLTDSNNQNIQKALDLYNKIYSDNIAAAVKSFFTADINSAFQNATVSLKGNFLFINIDFGAALGSGLVILTSYSPYVKDAEGKRKPLKAPQKAYMLMLETDLDPLGHIKLFSYYADKSLTIKFQDCSGAAKELINKNLHIFKEMVSREGITLKDVSFKAAKGKNPEGGVYPETFSDGKIINERI